MLLKLIWLYVKKKQDWKYLGLKIANIKFTANYVATYVLDLGLVVLRIVYLWHNVIKSAYMSLTHDEPHSYLNQVIYSILKKKSTSPLWLVFKMSNFWSDTFLNFTTKVDFFHLCIRQMIALNFFANYLLICAFCGTHRFLVGKALLAVNVYGLLQYSLSVVV